MEIIIDGYNVIGSDTGLTGNLERKRDSLVEQLVSYHKNKGHGVTVVFDGWRSGSIDEFEQKRNGICIVYSRLGEKADNVIIRRARKQSTGCVVVTSDREVRNAVERFGAVALYAGEFKNMLYHLAQPFDDNHDDELDHAQRETPKKGNPRRLSKKERKRREKLNKLRS
jgi:predicted RNA-binding protein with PIN domain